MAPPMLLDREFLKTLEKVALVCGNDLAGGVGSDHRSRERGSGLEFADYRGYSSGEDSRYLDWNAYLRLGKLFLKLYEAEQNIRVYILLDCSASMDCEEAGESKALYAQRLAATFAYLALLRLDTTVVIPFAERMGTPIITAGGRNRFFSVLSFLSELTCEGRTDVYRSVQGFLERFPSRGMVFVISDFFDEEGSNGAVQMLRSGGHDVVLIQVHSAEEQRPTMFGDFTLEDAESGAKQVVACTPQSAALYERAFLDASERLQRLVLRNGGRYARAVTSIPYQDFVLRSLQTNRVLA
ncbi:MAG TPA: DUF58 domain-containing protein [Terriglobales bacterium]|nr:DUF58 domain-containing protein [Terriglobales bacterium]